MFQDLLPGVHVQTCSCYMLIKRNTGIKINSDDFDVSFLFILVIVRVQFSVSSQKLRHQRARAQRHQQKYTGVLIIKNPIQAVFMEENLVFPNYTII